MKRTTQLLLWLAPLTFLALFYFYPLGSILHLSFMRSHGGAAENLILSLSSPGIRKVIWFTIWQAGISTLLTLGVGLPGAYLLARYDFRGKTLFQALSGIPFVMPTLVVAAAFNALLGARGWLNLGLMNLFMLSEPPLRITNSLVAIFSAHVFYNTTIVLRLVGDFWSHLDPRLNQAARTLGASGWRTLRYITLPLLLPAIYAAALLVFIFDFTSFGVILVLGGPRFATLEVEIYNQTTGLFNLPLAAALSLIQLACTLGLTVLYTRLSGRLVRPLALRSQAHTQKPLRSWRSRLFAGMVVSLLLAFLTVPLVGLAARSLTYIGAEGRAVPRPGEPPPQPERPGLTLAYYRELSINRRGSLFYAPPVVAIVISLAYALATMVLALALGFPAAWALARGPTAQGQATGLNRWLDPLLMLPLGTSAVTLGLGFIVALDQPPLDLRTSPMLVPLAHTLVAFPFVVRSLTPALQSIQPRLRAAAATLGASPWQVLRAIDLPLVGRAGLVAATFAFTISLGEFGATALIARPEFPTIPIAIYRLLSQPGALNYGQAMALSTILMLVTAAGMVAIEHLRITRAGEF
jgi:thiamine transport system permease protein